jgi:hypothetical protein
MANIRKEDPRFAGGTRSGSPRERWAYLKNVFA